MEEIRSIQSDVKIRNRLAAHRRKFGSPDFKDILRQVKWLLFEITDDTVIGESR